MGLPARGELGRGELERGGDVARADELNQVLLQERKVQRRVRVQDLLRVDELQVSISVRGCTLGCGRVVGVLLLIVDLIWLSYHHQRAACRAQLSAQTWP